MNYLLLLIPILVYFLFVISVLKIVRHRIAQLNSFALNFNGQITKSPSLFNSKYVIQGQVNSNCLTLTIKIGSDKKRTNHFDFALQHNFNCKQMEISRKDRLAGLNEFFGLSSNLQIGHPDIESWYYLSGDQSDLSRFFASPQRRDAIIHLTNMGMTKFLITSNRIIAYGANLGYDANYFARIVDYLKIIAETKTLTHVKVEQPPKAHLHPTCPYCRDLINPAQEAGIACHTCKTIHHAECMTEAGGCTIYACDNRNSPILNQRA